MNKTDKTEDAVNCSFCKNRFSDIVKSIPECGNNICGRCYENLKEDVDEETKQFKCVACDEKHKLPSRELHDNKALMTLLSKMKPPEKALHPSAKMLRDLVRNVEDKMEMLQAFDERGFIESYCEQIMQEVADTFESAVYHLQEIERNLMRQISEYRDKYLENLSKKSSETENTTKKELTELEKEVSEFNARWNNYFTRIEVFESESDIEAALTQTAEYISALESMEERMRKEALEWKTMVFHVNSQFLKEWKHVGMIEIIAELETTIPDGPSITLTGHSDAVNQMLFLPDGRFASCSCDRTIKVWNFLNGKELFQLRGHTDHVLSIALMPNGHLASGSTDETIKIWNLEQRKAIRTIKAHSGPIYTLRVLNNGNLASCSQDDAIKIWDLNSKEEKPVSIIKGHENISWWNPLFGVLSSDYIVTCSRQEEECILRVWNPNQLNPVKEVSTGLKDVRSLLVLSNDQVTLGFPKDGIIKIIDLEDETLSNSKEGLHEECANALAQISNGTLVTAGLDNSYMTIKLWNLNDWTLLQTINTGHSNWIESISISADEKFLASGSGDSTIKLWPITKIYKIDDPKNISESYQDKQLSISARSSIRETLSRRFTGHSKMVRCILFLHGGMLASCSDDNKIKIWSLKSGEELFELVAHSGTVNCLVLLPEGHLASGSADKTIKLWNLDKHQDFKTLIGHADSVVSLWILEHNKLVSCSNDGVIIFWDTNLKKKLEIKEDSTHLVGPLSNVNVVAFSHGLFKIFDHKSGQQLKSFDSKERNLKTFLILKNDNIASGSEDGTITIIDLRFNKILSTYKSSHIGAVSSLLQLPDSNIISAGRDCTVKIWSSEDGTLIRTIITGHIGPITSLSISAYGYQLAVGSEDSTVTLWERKQFNFNSNGNGKYSLPKGYTILAAIDQDFFTRTFLIDSETFPKIAKETKQPIRRKNKLLGPFESDIRGLKELRHDNLIRLIDSLEMPFTKQNWLLYMIFDDYTEFLSVKDYTRINMTKDNALISCSRMISALKWLIQLSDVLVYLHSKGTAHGNLSSRNVFLESESSIKLGVPELSRYFDEENTLDICLEDLRFYSPQRITPGNPLCQKDDCWSFGCILYELIAKKPAFDGLNYRDLTRAIVDEDSPDLANENYGPIYSKLVEKREALRLDSRTTNWELASLRERILLDGENLDSYLKKRDKNPSWKSKFQLIGSNCFNGLHGTDRLDLSQNEFTCIQEKPFKRFPKDRVADLVYLNFSNNKLSVVEDAFWMFTNLMCLDLSNNQLEALPDKLFSELTALKSLNLSTNKLGILAPGLFRTLNILDTLDLRHNRIEHLDVGVFFGLQNLQALDLSHNRLTDLKPGIFGDQFNLTRMQLNNNKLGSISSDLFQKTTKLLDLRFNHNQISLIETGAFKNLKNLRQLDLGFNKMTQIDDQLFSPITRLKSLSLASNKLDTIESVRFETMKKLQQLWLNDNTLQTIDLGTFNKNARLRELDLSDNYLSSIESYGWTRSEDLKLVISGNEFALTNNELVTKLESKNITLAFDHIKPIKTFPRED